MLIPVLNARQRMALLAAVAVLAAAATWAIVRYLSPSPPRTLTLSTGAADGAYHQFGLKYQAILKDSGVSLVLAPSSGSVENLKRLEDGSASAGFVQGGLGLLALDPLKGASDTNLRSLATVAFEPVWIFSRKLDLSNGLGALAGKRIAVGTADSGNYRVAASLLATYGVLDANGVPVAITPAKPPGPSSGTTQLILEGGMAAAAKLQAGLADAVILVAAPQAQAVALLLEDSSVDLASLRHADGLARRFPYFQVVSLKRGSINPQRNLPDKDVALIATTANLVVPDELHPALAYLLLDAARQTHSRPSLVSRAGDFPSPQGTDFPLAEEADRYFKNGRPFLQRYLPYWLANFVQRLILVMVPLLAVLVPVFKFVPSLLDWLQQNKLYRHYGELKFLEGDLAARTLDPDETRAAHAQLDRIERDIIANKFALDFSDRVFTLRQHVDYVREKLQAQAQAMRTAAPGPTP
jgi:TRAP-type uncharacterized transport system substrate-binding protein